MSDDSEGDAADKSERRMTRRQKTAIEESMATPRSAKSKKTAPKSAKKANGMRKPDSDDDEEEQPSVRTTRSAMKQPKTPVSKSSTVSSEDQEKSTVKRKRGNGKTAKEDPPGKSNHTPKQTPAKKSKVLVEEKENTEESSANEEELLRKDTEEDTGNDEEEKESVENEPQLKVTRSSRRKLQMEKEVTTKGKNEKETPAKKTPQRGRKVAVSEKIVNGDEEEGRSNGILEIEEEDISPVKRGRKPKGNVMENEEKDEDVESAPKLRGRKPKQQMIEDEGRKEKMDTVITKKKGKQQTEKGKEDTEEETAEDEEEEEERREREKEGPNMPDRDIEEEEQDEMEEREAIREAILTKKKAMKKPTDTFGPEIIRTNFITAVKSVYESKDEKTMQNALEVLMKTYLLMRERDSVDLENVVTAEFEHFFDCAIANDKMGKDEKGRMLKVLARFSIRLLLKNVAGCDEFFDYAISNADDKLRAQDAFVRVSILSFLQEIMQGSVEEKKEEEEEKKKKPKGKATAQSKKKGKGKAKEQENEVEEKREEEDEVDGHILTIQQRNRVYSVIKRHSCDQDALVRCAVIRACASIQNEPIPIDFTEAVELSPKDLIQQSFRDVNVDVRATAVKLLDPTEPPQIKHILAVATSEKHEKVRRMGFLRLGQIGIGRLEIEQRHRILHYLNDEHYCHTVEDVVLREWMRDLVLGGEEEKTRKKGGRKRKELSDEDRDKWVSAPLQLMRYLDCTSRAEEVLKILTHATLIARSEAGMKDKPVVDWIRTINNMCEDTNCMTATEYSHLTHPDTPLAARALLVEHWLHSLDFVSKHALDEPDKMNALGHLAPDMGTIAELILDVVEEERQRREQRYMALTKKKKTSKEEMKELMKRTDKSIVDVMLMMLRAFRCLDHSMDYGMKTWKKLLYRVISGELVDLNRMAFQEVMMDLITYHVKDGQYETEAFAIMELMEEHQHEPSDMDSSEEDEEENDDPHSPSTSTRRQESSAGRRMSASSPTPVTIKLLSLSEKLAAVYGLLKSNKLQNLSDDLRKVFNEVCLCFVQGDDSRSAPTVLRLMAMECIYVYGLFDAKWAEEYIVDFMNLAKAEDEVARIRGLALLIISDLVTHYSVVEVKQWLSKGDNDHSEIYELLSTLVVSDDMQVVFYAAQAATKLLIHNNAQSLDLVKTIAVLAFRLFHPASFSHPQLRSCISFFFQLFGMIGPRQQSVLSACVTEMIKIVENGDHDTMIDKNNKIKALHFVIASCKPSRYPGYNPSDPNRTSHQNLVNHIFTLLERQEEKGNIMMVEILAECTRDIELTGMDESSLDALYNQSFELVEMVKLTCGKNSSSVKAFRFILRNIELAREYLNRMEETAKAEGRPLDDSEKILPLEKDRATPLKTPIGKGRKGKALSTPQQDELDLELTAEPSTSRSAADVRRTPVSSTRSHLSRQARRKILPTIEEDTI